MLIYDVCFVMQCPANCHLISPGTAFCSEQSVLHCGAPPRRTTQHAAYEEQATKRAWEKTASQDTQRKGTDMHAPQTG